MIIRQSKGIDFPIFNYVKFNLVPVYIIAITIFLVVFSTWKMVIQSIRSRPNQIRKKDAAITPNCRRGLSILLFADHIGEITIKPPFDMFALPDLNSSVYGCDELNEIK